MDPALKLPHQTGRTRAMREHSLFISETSVSPRCSEWVHGRAAVASSESLLDKQNLRPHLHSLIAPMYHLGSEGPFKIPGDT